LAKLIIIAKHLYGGLGYNPFNPAMAGYVFLLISFPQQMTAWQLPFDVISSATVLDHTKTQLGLDFSLDKIYGWDRRHRNSRILCRKIIDNLGIDLIVPSAHTNKVAGVVIPLGKPQSNLRNEYKAFQLAYFPVDRWS
jgi:hypothetical protein